MRILRLGLVALASAVGGSMLGTALLIAPLIALGELGGDGSPTQMILAFSLPFALTLTAVLTALSMLWRESLSDRYRDYAGLILLSVPIGAAIPLPVVGGLGLVFGALFGPLTTAVWALLYSRFALPPEMRDLGHG